MRLCEVEVCTMLQEHLSGDGCFIFKKSEVLIKKCRTELLKLVLRYIAERFSSVEAPRLNLFLEVILLSGK